MIVIFFLERKLCKYKRLEITDWRVRMGPKSARIHPRLVLLRLHRHPAARRLALRQIRAQTRHHRWHGDHYLSNVARTGVCAYARRLGDLPARANGAGYGKSSAQCVKRRGGRSILNVCALFCTFHSGRI